jgi:large-conductance mechanosensitive channel
MKEKIISFLILACLVAFLYIVGLQGINKQEKVECIQWQAEAQQFNDYYLTEWQVNQCNHHGIKVGR